MRFRFVIDDHVLVRVEIGLDAHDLAGPAIALGVATIWQPELGSSPDGADAAATNVPGHGPPAFM